MPSLILKMHTTNIVINDAFVLHNDLAQILPITFDIVKCYSMFTEQTIVGSVIVGGGGSGVGRPAAAVRPGEEGRGTERLVYTTFIIWNLFHNVIYDNTGTKCSKGCLRC